MEEKIDYEKIYELSKIYSEKYPDYIERVDNNQDYSELEQELNRLIREINELQGIKVKYNK